MDRLKTYIFRQGLSSHPHFINSGVKYYKRKIEIINAVILTTALIISMNPLQKERREIDEDKKSSKKDENRRKTGEKWRKIRRDDDPVVKNTQNENLTQ